MHGASLIQDLAVVMIVAGLVAILFHRFKQPVVLGYILAGLIIGPHTPPFSLIHDEATIDTLSELGIVFLMFGLGLHFSLGKLKKVGSTAFIASSLEIIFMVLVGYLVGRFMGWNKMNSIFLGAMLSISSTTIIVKALNELGMAKEHFSELIFGILIVEDILAIAMLALLSSIAMTGNLNVVDVVMTVGKLGIFLTTVLVIGLLFVPRLLDYVASFKSNEMLLVAVLGLCFGVCMLAIKMDYSMALGAFLIGAIIAETKAIHLIETLIEPIRDLFSAIFFVSIGLLIEPRLLWQYAFPILLITFVVVAGKVTSCAFGTFVAGHDTRKSFRVGMGMAQIGEFSFIIAALGLKLKVIEPFLYPIAVAVSSITTLLTPYLIKNSDAVVGWFDRVAPPGVVGYLDLYSKWVERIWKSDDDITKKIAKKLGMQISLNVTLITALLLVAVWLKDPFETLFKHQPFILDHSHALIWLGAVIVGMPLFIASFRQLDVLGVLVAEICAPDEAAGARGPIIRRLIANTVLLAGSGAFGLWVLLVSAALLPDWRLLIGLLLLIAVVTFFSWRKLIQVYLGAQQSLDETLGRGDGTKD